MDDPASRVPRSTEWIAALLGLVVIGLQILGQWVQATLKVGKWESTFPLKTPATGTRCWKCGPAFGDLADDIQLLRHWTHHLGSFDRLALGGNILHHAVSSDHRRFPTWHGKLGRPFQMSELLMRSGSNSFALSNISLTIVTLPAPACQVLRITDDIELNLSCTGWTKRAFPIVQWCSPMNSFDEEMKSLVWWCVKMSYLEQFMRCFSFTWGVNKRPAGSLVCEVH